MSAAGVRRAGVFLTAMIVFQGAAARGAEGSPPAGSAYDILVAPFFQARCVECHGEQKQKAKLALHSWEMLTRGSDAGPVLVAGKPGESVLLERLRLPVTDEDHMPPEDHPQPAAEEISLLEHWIARGASATATIDELQLPAALAQAATTLPAKLAAVARARTPIEPRWEFDPAAVARSRAPLAETVAGLQMRFPGALSYESRTSAALHFTAAGFGRDFGDPELATLAPLGAELVSLDLSGTAVTDRSAERLAAFPNLRVLRIAYTDVGDVTAQAVASLPRLESLVLSGTNVTAGSVSSLSKMRALKVLRLAGTAAQQPAQDANLPVTPSAAELLDRNGKGD